MFEMKFRVRVAACTLAPLEQTARVAPSGAGYGLTPLYHCTIVPLYSCSGDPVVTLKRLRSAFGLHPSAICQLTYYAGHSRLDHLPTTRPPSLSHPTVSTVVPRPFYQNSSTRQKT